MGKKLERKTSNDALNIQKVERLEEGENPGKLNRILVFYTRLVNGETIRIKEEADRYHVSEKSIQRDLACIRDFLGEDVGQKGYFDEIENLGSQKGYRLKNTGSEKLTEEEVFTICKILLASRTLTKKEMDHIIDGLIGDCVSKDNQKKIKQTIQNECHYYTGPRHGAELINKLAALEDAVYHSKCIMVEYKKVDNTTVQRKLCPVGLLISEYYFYLVAHIDGKEVRKALNLDDDYASPTHYRVDRIQKFEVLAENFRVPVRFEEGVYRKKVQYMYGGKPRRVKFKYKGKSIEAVLDRLPTAEILSEKDGVYIVTAEVIGEGVDMWLKSQGENVEMMGGKEK